CTTSASGEPTPAPTSCSSSRTCTSASSTPPPANYCASSPSTPPATTSPSADHQAHQTNNPEPQIVGSGSFLCLERSHQCPRQDSNLRTRLRRPLLYPLSYGGGESHEDTSLAAAAWHRSDHENWLCGPMVASTLKHVEAYLGRVLVVDDSEIVRALIRVNLELEGFEVVTAVDGLDCLDKVLSVEPTVVTLDIVMPRLDGFSTAIRLREDQRTRHLPIVMITAAAQGRDLARGRE